MSTPILTAYVLMWPALVFVVLAVVSTAFFGEWAKARREGRDLV